MTKGMIEVEGMEFYAYHGCYETERVVGNRFRVDVAVEADCGAAAETDDIERAVNYVRVYEIVAREMAVKSHLLEHVAGRILEALHRELPEVEHARVKVAKLNPPLGGKIGATSVTLEK